MATRTVWDGQFIQHREAAQAAADAGAGLVQVFAGPHGWQPGFFMEYGSAFPLPAIPAATLSSIDPATAVINTDGVEVIATGTNFRLTDEVLVEGTMVQSAYVNATTRTFIMPKSFVDGVVTVAIRDTYGRISDTQDFTWTATGLFEEPVPDPEP